MRYWSSPIPLMAAVFVLCALTGAAARADFLPGSAVNADGTLASHPRNPNDTPEAQSRPEFTIQNLDYLVTPGFTVLLESSADSKIPLAGPPPGEGVKGVTSTIELGNLTNGTVGNWSDVAQYVNVTDANGTKHGRIYYSSDPEDATKGDTGTVLDTITANLGSNTGMASPLTTDNIVFLLERGKGNSGDSGAGEADTDQKYLTDNVTYNLHSDPPGTANPDLSTPEPASLVLSGIASVALAGAGGWRRWRKPVLVS